MRKLKSSIPGLGYPSGRDDKLKTSKGFLDGRRRDDGAEGLWRIRNGLYDLNEFIKSHPGGEEWLQLTRGTDITEVFEAHHISDRAHKMLPKFYIRDAIAPRQCPLTFEPDGFYYKFKKRALINLKNVNYHQPAFITNIIMDLTVLAFFMLCILAAKTQHWVNIVSAGLLLAWTLNISHNYLHMKDSFRVYYFDLTGWSSKEFRISHVLSHHIYPNTLWDMEVYAFEPFLNWLPGENKPSLIYNAVSVLISPVVWSLIFLAKIITRFYLIVGSEKEPVEFRDIVPFAVPFILTIGAPSFYVAMKIWMLILAIGGLAFGFIGTNAAHHHPDIFHDGDIYRKDMDWGLLELDAVRGRKDIDKSLFLVLTHYGQHILHHLLPTVDHAYLPLCADALKETCAEFNIDVSDNDLTQWELIKGQFKQLLRKEVKYNSR